MSRDKSTKVEARGADEPGPALAVHRQAEKPNGILHVNQDTVLANCPTNLDLSTPRGKALAFNALGESDYEISQAVPTRIDAVSYLVYPCTMWNEETGEISEFSWIVLFDKLGKIVKTTSDIVKQGIVQLLSMYSPAEWASGIKLMVEPRVSRKSKRIYHAIKIDMDAYLDQ